ncbi:MAG: sigma-70 family RNA polymerase sigma factor [Ruminococcus sp.]|nr:sigma-70 family RNA polymerase sigma factor [Ruminococcus sp.]MBQ7133289.1 sigma-70 family RNA polymerase sigma factor [Ruminococcus sp.]
MQLDCINITQENSNLVSYSVYQSAGTNKTDLMKMRQLLNIALKTELTDRQRECLEMYYYKNLKMVEIASLLSVSPSTVTRHIKAAQRKLKNLAKYC